LDKHRQNLRVVIQDDGQGFDLDAVLHGQNRKSFGMTTMSERTGAIGGSLDIFTMQGAGTCVTVTVPLDAKEG
jgi:signal transduction histidine kinase